MTASESAQLTRLREQVAKDNSYLTQAANSPEYQARLQNLNELRNSEGYRLALSEVTANQAAITGIKQFYAAVDGQVPNFGRRVWGGVQFVGGVGLVGSSAVGEFGSGGLGTALVVGGVVLGADEMWTGGYKALYGLDRNSLTFMAAEKACQAAGGENCASKAAWADFGLKFGTNIGLLGLSSNASRVGGSASDLIEVGSKKIGPWGGEVSNITKGDVFTQCAAGSCVSATGQILTNGTVTEYQLLGKLGEWSTPVALSRALNEMAPLGGGRTWIGGYFNSAEDALSVASRQTIGAVLQAPNAPAHMVTITPVGSNSFLVLDTGAGLSYNVTSGWIKQYVSGGVWKSP